MLTLIHVHLWPHEEDNIIHHIYSYLLDHFEIDVSLAFGFVRGSENLGVDELATANKEVA